MPTPSEILHLLDTRARGFTFPILNNAACDLLGTRLHVWADGTDWAIVIEHLAHSPLIPGHAGVSNSLYAFGPGVAVPLTFGIAAMLNPTSDSPYYPFFHPHNPDVVFPLCSLVCVRGVEVTVPRMRHEFENEGLPLPEGDIPVREALRVIAGQFLPKMYLYATDAELAAVVKPNLPQVLSLEEWHHPNVAIGEMPSQTPSFQQIAEVAATGNPALYTEAAITPNTHWRHWGPAE